MARSASNDVLDALLNEIATSNRISVCSAEPTTHAEAGTTYMLAATVMSGGDFSNSDGASGRKVTVAQQSNIAIDNTGTATHVALSDATTVLFVTTCTSQVLTSGGTVTVPAFDIQVDDPIAL